MEEMPSDEEGADTAPGVPRPVPTRCENKTGCLRPSIGALFTGVWRMAHQGKAPDSGQTQGTNLDATRAGPAGRRMYWAKRDRGLGFVLVLCLLTCIVARITAAPSPTGGAPPSEQAQHDKDKHPTPHARQGPQGHTCWHIAGSRQGIGFATIQCAATSNKIRQALLNQQVPVWNAPKAEAHQETHMVTFNGSTPKTIVNAPLFMIFSLRNEGESMLIFPSYPLFFRKQSNPHMAMQTFGWGQREAEPLRDVLGVSHTKTFPELTIAEKTQAHIANTLRRSCSSGAYGNRLVGFELQVLDVHDERDEALVKHLINMHKKGFCEEDLLQGITDDNNCGADLLDVEMTHDSRKPAHVYMPSQDQVDRPMPVVLNLDVEDSGHLSAVVKLNCRHPMWNRTCYTSCAHVGTPSPACDVASIAQLVQTYPDGTCASDAHVSFDTIRQHHYDACGADLFKVKSFDDRQQRWNKPCVRGGSAQVGSTSTLLVRLVHRCQDGSCADSAHVFLDSIVRHDHNDGELTLYEALLDDTAMPMTVYVTLGVFTAYDGYDVRLGEEFVSRPESFFDNICRHHHDDDQDHLYEILPNETAMQLVTMRQNVP